MMAVRPTWADLKISRTCLISDIILIYFRKALIQALKKILKKDREVLFAYLYGSYATNADHPGSDIDIAVYIEPSDIKNYVKKQEGLTTTLITELHNDHIDLRILNT
jgi:hypothetical protein